MKSQVSELRGEDGKVSPGRSRPWPLSQRAARVSRDAGAGISGARAGPQLSAASSQVTEAILDRGKKLPADVVVVGIGKQCPPSPLSQGCSLAPGQLWPDTSPRAAPGMLGRHSVLPRAPPQGLRWTCCCERGPGSAPASAQGQHPSLGTRMGPSIHPLLSAPGVSPASDFLKGSPVALDSHGAVLVDLVRMLRPWLCHHCSCLHPLTAPCPPTAHEDQRLEGLCCRRCGCLPGRSAGGRENRHQPLAGGSSTW